MNVLIVNGEIANIAEINLNHLLSDTVFLLSQKVWYGYGGIPLFAENLEQMKNQVEALKLPFPIEFENQRELFRLVKRLLNKNKFYRSGHVYLQLIWNDNTIQTLVTCNAYNGFHFPFSEAGLLITFSNQKKHSQNSFNRFLFFNQILWEAGLAEIRQSPFQQVIFLNEMNALCESAYANIFMIKEDKLFTPAIESGCYEDVLRPVILEMAKKSGLRVFEMEIIDKSKVFEMDEIFIASEMLGIKWISGIENKRFLHHQSERIYEKLNELLKIKAGY